MSEERPTDPTEITREPIAAPTSESPPTSTDPTLGPEAKKKPTRRKARLKRERMKSSLAEVLDVEGAAEALGVSSRLVLRLLRKGELPGKKVGREWRILRSAIVSWLRTTEDETPRWMKQAIDSGKATVEAKK